MKEKNIKKFNFIVLILFPIILLISSVIYNVYSFGIKTRLEMELDTLNDSLSQKMESKYIDMMNIYFKDELDNHIIADEFTNFVREQIRLGITPNLDSFEFSIENILSNSVRYTTYSILFICFLILVMAFTLYFINDNFHNKMKEKILISENKIIEKKPMTINNIINSSYNSSIKSELEEMYKKLIDEIKNLNDDNALEILDKMFQIDDKSFLALNGAGIFYSKIYRRDSKEYIFKKASEYFEYSLTLYSGNENISNNKAVLHSIRYEIKNLENDYKDALMIFDELLSHNDLDIELLNNRATLYSVKYKVTSEDKLFDKALKDYNKLMEIDYNNVCALNNRSALFFNKYKSSNDKKYFNKSIEDCNRAFKINPSTSNNMELAYMYKF